MPLRLGTLNQLIHLLQALFRSLSNFKEIFLSQWFFLFSLFLLLSSQHLPCLILGKESERMWGYLPSQSTFLCVPPCAGCSELLVFNVPSFPLLLGADPSAGAFLFAGHHFTELSQNSFCRTFSLLLPTPSLAHFWHSEQAVQLLMIALFTLKQFIYTSALPTQRNGPPGGRDHD